METSLDETLKETSLELLPPSSTDLPLSGSNVLAAISSYRTLTQTYNNLYNLSFEDFCCGLGHHEQCLVISHIHMLLIDELLSKVCGVKEFSNYF